MIADAISAVRPGARRANIEEYIKRMKDMENLVLSFPGVEKAYALSAGREVRVFVNPRNISDLEAEKLSRDIAIGIQDNLQYPGEVKVMVSRENRFVEYAR
jgi:ribonuclease Y